MKTRDDVLLEQAYQKVVLREAEHLSPSEHIRHKDQTPYVRDGLGVEKSKHKTQDMKFASKEFLLKKLVGLIAERDEAQQGDYGHDVLGQQIDEVWSTLEGMGMSTQEINQYCQSAQDAGQGPTQDDMYYTKLK